MQHPPAGPPQPAHRQVLLLLCVAPGLALLREQARPALLADPARGGRPEQAGLAHVVAAGGDVQGDARGHGQGRERGREEVCTG